MRAPVFLVPVLLLASPRVSPQSPIRFSLWALLDAYPPAASAVSDPWSYPAERIREAAPFFAEGLTWGWTFSYTPPDAARGVPEFFAFAPDRPEGAPPDAGRLVFDSPRVEGNRLWCRVDCFPSPAAVLRRKQWESVSFRRISGRGFAPLADGFDGARSASGEALKNAVREYARAFVKNKPKEIAGRVLLAAPPVLSINAGRYEARLDFFADVDTILPYTRF